LSLEKLSRDRALAALVKLAARLEDPRLELFHFFLEQMRPLTRSELLRLIRLDVLQLTPDQLDRSLSYLHRTKFLERKHCGKQVLYFPII